MKTQHMVAIILCLISFVGLAQANENSAKSKAEIINNWVVIHAGTLLAVPGEGIKKQQTLVIKNNKIEEIINGYVDFKPKKADRLKTINLKNSFVMPGLIYMHVHLDSNGPK